MSERFDTEAWRREHPELVYNLGPACKVCGWHPQGRGKAGDFGRLCRSVDRHEEKEHPEFKEWQKNMPSLRELISQIHQDCTHEVTGQCGCICGCESNLYECKAFSHERICTDCELRVNRGDEGHGIADDIRERLAEYDQRAAQRPLQEVE